MRYIYMEVFCDGACTGNPGPGGWAALTYSGEQKRGIAGYVSSTTNNQMELMAVIKGIQYLISPNHVTSVFTDSLYVYKGIVEWSKKWEKQGWENSKKKQVKNVNLWKKLCELNAQYKLQWHWIKGHAGNYGNELADTMAKKAIKFKHEEKYFNF